MLVRLEELELVKGVVSEEKIRERIQKGIPTSLGIERRAAIALIKQITVEQDLQKQGLIRMHLMDKGDYEDTVYMRDDIHSITRVLGCTPADLEFDGQLDILTIADKTSKGVGFKFKNAENGKIRAYMGRVLVAGYEEVEDKVTRLSSVRDDIWEKIELV